MMKKQQTVYRELDVSRLLFMRCLCVACLFFAFRFAGAATADSGKFPLLKNLVAPTNGTHEIGMFTVDGEIFDATDDDYSNMRIFDNENRETPFLVRVAVKTTPVVTEKPLQMAPLSFEQVSSNRIEFTVENTNNEAIPCAVVIITRHKNYEKQVTVLGSDDRANWKVLASIVPIFDYSRYMDLNNNRVEMEPGSFRYYKVAIANFAEARQSPLLNVVREKRGDEIAREFEQSTLITEDFKIEEMRFLQKKESVVEGEKISTQYAAHNLSVTNDLKKQETIVTIDSEREPLTSLTVFAKDPNFSRTVAVYGSNASETVRKGSARIQEDDWQKIASSAISMVAVDGFVQDRKTIQLGRPCRYRHYRIVVHNMDNPPLAVFGVRVEGEVHEALFFRDPVREYRLLFGATDIQAPRYDIATVLGNKPVGPDVDIFELSRACHNPKIEHKKAGPRRIVSNKTLITGAVLVMVVTLIWLIAVALKGMSDMKQE